MRGYNGAMGHWTCFSINSDQYASPRSVGTLEEFFRASKTVCGMRMKIKPRQGMSQRYLVSLTLFLIWVIYAVDKLSESYESNIVAKQVFHSKTIARIIKTKRRLYEEHLSNIAKLIVEWFTVTKEHYMDELLNKHNYIYEFNSNLCKNTDLDVLIVIHSDPANYAQRNIIRETSCSLNGIVNMKYACIFMLGERYDERLQTRLAQEALTHRDIVQGNFLDTYHNLTFKHVMALHWITSQCSDVNTIVKIDDDVFVDVFKLARFATETGHFNNTFYCPVLRFVRPKRYDGKWVTHRKEYPFTFFPHYCAGMSYIISADSAKRLSEASKNMGFYWIDDVYVTGILALKAGIGHKQFAAQDGAVNALFLASESNVHIDDGMFFHRFSAWGQLWKGFKLRYGLETG